MRPTERGFAQGVTHAGSRLGAALTPPIVGCAIMVPFILAGAPRFWFLDFWAWYGPPSGIFTIATRPRSIAVSIAAERELIGSGRKRSTDIPWRKILSHGNLWILAVMYFCYNFNLNVYNDWFPTYLHDSRGMTLAKMGIYASLPLFAGTLGDLLGGWFSDRVLTAHQQRQSGAALGGHCGIPALGRGHDPGCADARSENFRRVLLCGFLRPGMDRGDFLGCAARYRRRFRRLGFSGDEYTGQRRRRFVGGRCDLRGHSLWLERAHFL